MQQCQALILLSPWKNLNVFAIFWRCLFIIFMLYIKINNKYD